MSPFCDCVWNEKKKTWTFPLQVKQETLAAVWAGFRVCVCVCEPAACLHLLHPSPCSYPTRPRCLFSSAGVLSGDGSSGTHVPSFWHWPRVIEMQTRNALNQMGSKSSKYLAKTLFSLMEPACLCSMKRGWSRWRLRAAGVHLKRPQIK